MNRSDLLHGGLVWTGLIAQLQSIPGADFIESATVICGRGGKWQGVVRKGDFEKGHPCDVFLPDSLLPHTQEFSFMEKNGWRVRMCRFKGAPSEVLIMKQCYLTITLPVGIDVTERYDVTKYCKPVPAHLNGLAKGMFPGFLRKTDEPNYQTHMDMVMALKGKPYYITQKMDGSSCTVYRYKGEFGVCSRNLDLERDDENGYWKVANKYKLEERLPEGYAVQFEVCGPGIQSNPAGLKEIDGFAFSIWDIVRKRYAEFSEFKEMLRSLYMPCCLVLEVDDFFNPECIPKVGEGTYLNGAVHEGVVIRSQFNIGYLTWEFPISFKVINLDYKD